MEQMMSESQARVGRERSGQESVPGSSRRVERAVSDLIVAARNWRLLAVTTSAVALVAVLGLIVDRDQTQGHSLYRRGGQTWARW